VGGWGERFSVTVAFGFKTVNTGLRTIGHCFNLLRVDTFVLLGCYTAVIGSYGCFGTTYA
jgi:hypothetical protein